VKDIHEAPLKFFRVVDSTQEWGKVIHGEILARTYEPPTTYTGEGDGPR
jgi:hypothetical protein